MPRLPIDYSKTIMYKLVCNDLSITECYVGHTTDMTKRKSQHKKCCNNEKADSHNEKKYTFIRENGGWENWSMVMIEEYPCDNRIEAEKRERFWFEDLNSQLNTNRPYATIEERNEYLKQYQKEYYQQNKINYKYDNEKKKQFYQANKDKINEYQRRRYALNKLKS